MRKQLLAAFAAATLGVPGLALAQNSGSYGQDQGSPDSAVPPSNPGTQNPDQGSMDSPNYDNPDSAAPSEGSNVRTAMPAMAPIDTAQAQKLFAGKAKTFEISGKVIQMSPDQNQLTIQRTDMPDAQLWLADQTKITMKGEKATLQDLKPGTEVKAKFNLVDQNPVATEVMVSKAAANSGSKGTTKHGAMNNPNP